MSFTLGKMFQFPSNGKAYLNLLMDQEPLTRGPQFQFPSNGKAYLNTAPVVDVEEAPSFNSLQTGKRI